MIEKAYAKINIGLIVNGMRPDGYHDIDTYMAAIDLHDTLDIDIRPGDCFSCTIRGNEGYLDRGPDLMEKAARIFSEETGYLFSIDINIDKRIPVKAGLGGGSSDAAAVLRALRAFYSYGGDIIPMAARVGSDVPFFASGFKAAHVRGRGEIAEPAEAPDEHILLLVPQLPSDTPSAYKALDSIERPARCLPPLCAHPEKKDFPNDFELISAPIASAEPGSFLSMSGSGNTWYLFYRDFSFQDIQIMVECYTIRTEFI